MFNRNEDLTKIFDKGYNVNKNTSDNIQKSVNDFNKRMFGVVDKDEMRREAREANSVSSKVNNLKSRMDGFNRNNFR